MPTAEQLKTVFARIGYKPTQEQERVHLSPARIRLVAGGERSGKSYSSAMDLVARLFYGKLFWLVAADYERTKVEFNYICQALDQLHIRYLASKAVDPGQIEIEGGFLVLTKSAKDPRKLAAEAPDGILVCEASQIDYDTYQRLRGRLAEKRGWMLMSGTFESSLGWYVEAFERGKAQNAEGLVSFSIPTWTNTNIFPGGRQDPEIKLLESTFSPEWFMERFGGVPTPPKGLVFPEFKMHLHTGTEKEFTFDHTGLCYLFVDPGYASAYSVLVAQQKGEELSIIDEVYERGLITSDIIKLCKQRPWWNRVIGGSIDIAGTQHQAMAAPAEIWLQEGGITLTSRRLLIRDGIEAVKRFLLVSPQTQRPLLHINAMCRGLIAEFGGCPNPLDGQARPYQWRMDNTGNIIGHEPEDKNNHSIKALAYGIVGLFGFAVLSEQKVKVNFF